MPGGATRVGERLLVPLTALEPDFARTFLPQERKRNIYVTGENDWVSTLEVRVPAGYSARELPAPTQLEGAGFRSTVEVRATPQGAMVKRTLAHHQGTWGVAEYPKARAAVRAYAEVRDQTLVFERAK